MIRAKLRVSFVRIVEDAASPSKIATEFGKFDFELIMLFTKLLVLEQKLPKPILDLNALN